MMSFSTSVFCWQSSPHALYIDIAITKLTPKTQKEIQKYLDYPLNKPQDISFSSSVPKIYQSWADNIKHVSWRNQTAKKFYYQYHFIHAIGYLNESVNPKIAKKRILEVINTSQGDNLINGTESLLKTLMTSDESVQNKSIALRILLSQIGDIHQPLHIIDLHINHHSTYNQNTIQASPAVEVRYSENKWIGISKLHEIWDAAGGLFFTETPIDIEKVHAIKHDLMKKYNTTLDIHTKDPHPLNWAIESYVIGSEVTSSKWIHYQITPKRNWAHFENQKKYVQMTQDVTQRQLYIAGLRAAKLFNAIFDPTHAPTAYVQYIQDLKSNPQIKTLKQLPPIE